MGDENTFSVSALRSNIYQIIDQALNSGVPITIVRKGKTLKIVPEEKKNKFSNLKKREGLNCDPDELVSISWESEWNSDDVC